MEGICDPRFGPNQASSALSNCFGRTERFLSSGNGGGRSFLLQHRPSRVRGFPAVAQEKPKSKIKEDKREQVQSRTRGCQDSPIFISTQRGYESARSYKIKKERTFAV